MALCLSAVAPCTAVLDIPLTNPSFETGDLTGWTTAGEATEVTVFNVTGADLFVGDAISDGTNVAGIVRKTDVDLYQSLSDLYTAFRTHRFSCFVGEAIDNSGPDMRPLSMELRRADTNAVLASTTITDVDVDNGFMYLFSVEYTAPFALNGVEIRVGFSSSVTGKIAYVDDCSLITFIE